MQVFLKKVNELIPYENNPRDNEEAVQFVANSIKEFGFKVPIIIDKDNVIVTGHTRLLAAKELGLKEVPVIVADDLTPEQIKAFRIADNKVAEKALWDNEKLAQEIKDLDYNFKDFGFNDFELGLLNDDVSFDEDMFNELFQPNPESAEAEEGETEHHERKKQRIQCPCCGEFFDFQPGMIRGD